MKIRTIIVDDEQPARNKLKLFLASEKDFTLICECKNGTDAIAALGKYRADVVFLDIQMPEVDGFSVIASVPKERLPVVVFVTAYDTFAVKAFEIHALDYLLKPFDRERFQQSVVRIRKAMDRSSIERHHSQILSILDDIKTHRTHPERILIKSAGRVYFVNIDDVDWVEAVGNYVKLHVGNEPHLIRKTMNALERQLHQRKFVRIHRSTLVNIDRIKELQPWFQGDYHAVLHNGKRLSVSKSCRKKLTEILGRGS